MKKILSILVILLLIVIAGIFILGMDYSKITGSLKSGEVAEEVSKDDSLEVIEEEINDTELIEFEEELEAIEAEIDQL